MAAEILAAELDLDLYQIDLASVVSKYIGETEKNLRRDLRRAPRQSGAILLFDEADALFGKRSEVTRQPRPLRQPGDQLPAPADGVLPRRRHPDHQHAARARPRVPAPHPLHRAVPVSRRGRTGRAIWRRHLPAGDPDWPGSTSTSSPSSTWRAASSATSPRTRRSSPPTTAGRRGQARAGRGAHRVRQARQAARRAAETRGLTMNRQPQCPSRCTSTSACITALHRPPGIGAASARRARTGGRSPAQAPCARRYAIGLHAGRRQRGRLRRCGAAARSRPALAAAGGSPALPAPERPPRRHRRRCARPDRESRHV